MRMADRREPDPKEAHTILRTALRKVPASEWPAAPWHLGGPPLSCPAVEQIRIGLWCAGLLHDRAKPGEAKELVRLRVQVQGALTSLSRRRKPAPLTGWVEQKTDSAPLACLRRTVKGTATLLRGKQDLVFTSINSAVLRTVNELTAQPRPMGVREFLSQLDQRLLCGELAGAYRERVKEPAPRLERVLFRWGAARDKPTCFLAKLDSGRLGLLVRLASKSRRSGWTWVEGSRDDVLATVPDELLEVVTQRVFAQTGEPS